MSRIPLPIDEVLPEVLTALRGGNVVLGAPTGAGKTTRVPPALLAAADGLIIMLEPRRVAARAAAMRMAQELDEPVGQTVGYQVRFDRNASAATRILVVTDGVLLRRLAADPFLDDVAVVIFDEVHERGLLSDVALAMTRHLQQQVRPDLRLVAMSATLDTDAFAGFLDATVVHSAGRTYPVAIRYLARDDDRPMEAVVADAVEQALQQDDGDVLAFLPGAAEISRVLRTLTPRLQGVDLVPLHGRLPPDAQDLALSPGRRQRAVLATNVAETSVTIPGVRTVIDSGWVRQAQHDAGRGLDRLVVVPNSRASADQRAGRAGRTGPGTAWRLWSERAHAARSDHDTPEVRRVDLAATLLLLHAWGEPDPFAIPWLDPPPPFAVEAAEELLVRLGALQGGALTDLGTAMARLPAHPRVARMLLHAHAHGVLAPAAEVAALLQDRLPLRRDEAHHTTDNDLEDLREALARDGAHGWRAVSPGAIHRTRQAARQLLDATQSALGASRGGGQEQDLRMALLAGWPDRIGQERGDRIVLATGRGARMHRSSGVRAPWVVAIDVRDTDRTEADIYLAAAIDPAWLTPSTEVEVRWDASKDRVIASRVARLGALEVSRQDGVSAPRDAVHAALAQAIRAAPDRAMPRDADTLRLLGRLRFLALVRPDLDLPAHDTADLLDVAVAIARDARSLAEVASGPWRSALHDRLPWSVRPQLAQLAPETLEVPSGSHIRLDYPDTGPPVLAVRMQELFGLPDTPRVSGVPVLLHLLAPNRRPQQVTDDLAGFWARAWPLIRKELRGRYPKHAWPDDPLTAPAERSPGRRRS